MISLLLLPLALLPAFGLASFLSGARSRIAGALGAGGAAVSGLIGLGATIFALLSGASPSLSLPWNTTIGASFSIGFDALSGFFLLPIYALTAVCAVFGAGYLGVGREHGGAGDDRGSSRNAGSSWLFYGVLAASMALVVMARNAVLFLVAWELMSVSSWALVSHEHEREESRQAGITYLVATQIGTAFLIVMFLVLGAMANAASPAATPASGDGNGGQGAVLDFARFSAAGAGAGSAGASAFAGPAVGIVFILALVGFGTKAGIVPLHVWLPEAHPAAPSHVSALMSGVMIKTGIYGILRVLTFLGTPPAWWGWTVAGIGAVSGIIGVLFALAQHDIKRLLAYHSVENIGIICLGLGVGLLGVSYRAPVVAALGFAGGLLHVLNHALFKGLLFLGAGAAARAAGTREMDRQGGLLRRMPVTGISFLIGAAAISGLPPLNGFVSELLVFSGAVHAVTLPAATIAAAAAVVVASLALIGGLAAACFTKAFGISFLGQPRTPEAAAAAEQGGLLLAPMLALAAACAAIGALGPLALGAISPLAAGMAGLSSPAAANLLAPSAAALARVVLAAAALAGITGILVLARALLLRRRTVTESGTWGCGSTASSPRMQYTASSFAQPLTSLFRGILRTRRSWRPPAELFPSEAAFSTETPDTFAQRIFRPALGGVGMLLSRLGWLQHGRLQLYVMYLAAALLVLLVWRLS